MIEVATLTGQVLLLDTQVSSTPRGADGMERRTQDLDVRVGRRHPGRHGRFQHLPAARGVAGQHPALQTHRPWSRLPRERVPEAAAGSGARRRSRSRGSTRQ